MSVILVASICVINILLWIIFFSKFKKLFSTEDIIQSTRKELDKMITDINRNTERDISLIQDKIVDLKKVIAEADKKLSVITSEKNKRLLEKSYKQKLSTIADSKNEKNLIQKAAEKYQSVKTGSDYTLTNDGFKKKSDKEELISNKNSVEQEKSEYLKVPNIYISKNQIIKEKSFNKQVKELYNKGETVEEIASRFSKSITEIQLAIDLTSEL